ncbi:MAG TPA: glutamine-synthetase adenylyltransferase [Bryobacteraceae bacterium]|nr:glutamine-synthetase adenylyltransferase [Bryobacteraceae bacterium]
MGKLAAPAIRTVSALLPSLPNPDDSVHFLNRLIAESPDAARQITNNATTLRYALTIFSYSRFLADAVIRYPEWLISISEAGDLHRGFLADQYETLLASSLPPDGTPQPVDLALFRRRQMLRIVLRDVLGFADLSETAEDISSLADAILNVTWNAVRRDLSREMGGAGRDGLFSVIALGKLGGRELNYSSDIDLMYIFSAPEKKPGDAAMHPREFFKLAATRLTDMLSAYTPEGLCYRVDLRLRPEGRYGEICPSLASAKQYYATRARDWELQMLIKARVAAGDTTPGRELLDFVEPLIYKTTTDFRTVEAVSETRARIHEKQREKQLAGRQTGINVKLAKGGIRDIEFLVQCLQRLHGGQDPWVRHGGTLLALSRLRDKELLSPAEYSRLASAYQFLRHLEHRLQFDEDSQTHTLPAGKANLDLLARKMPTGAKDAAGLARELNSCLASVQDLYERVIHSRLAEREAEKVLEADVPADENGGEEYGPERVEFPSGNMRRFLELRAPMFAQLVTSGAISRSQASFESFLEKVVAFPEWLDMLEKDHEVARCTIDVFEHSQYLADQLVSHTDLLLEIRAACGVKQGRTGFHAPRDADELRRFFREQVMRIESDSVYHRAPVFKTLNRTSELAESVIAGAYEMAVQEASAMTPPASPSYIPANQMMVIALGRLGMLEFDLGSDADLVFLLPDEDASEVLFWTSVAERMIGTIGAYTGEGVVFTIDTRLRPNGREGELVQTEAAYRDYFANRAEAWEGITYMKARAVAGNLERATEFLGELQEVDWRRYGQSGRSRAELAAMRARLEREQGARNPLKAGSGGYYDIDFALMYLRLKSAGVFYKALNTPARIDVIEKMGHLDREDAAFLREAATFYRAVDHGMRVATGHAEGRLPSNPANLATLTELARRWTPASLHDAPLPDVLKRIQRDTRAFFDRVFSASR